MMFHVKHLKYWGFLVILALFNGCNEDSIRENEEPINRIIQSRKDIKTPTDVMNIYYKFMWPESDTNYVIAEQKLPKERFEVTLIRENTGDDSMQSEKIMMILKHDEEKWKVITIERSWKCHKGRGNTEWGIEPCN